MKLTVHREALLKPLTQVSNIVDRRQTMSILGNVLLRVSSTGTVLTATDNDIEIVAHIVADAAIPGEITLPARKLVDICRALPDQARVELTVENERAVLRAGRSRFTLTTLPARDFPSIEEFTIQSELSVPQRDIHALIENTQFAMSQQDTRFYLVGLMLEFGQGRLRAVATDGHRLALSEISADIPAQEIQQVIVPRKGVFELMRLLESSDQAVYLQLGSNHLRAVTPQFSMTIKLIDGRFPDYHRVLPKGGDKVVLCNRLELSQALARTAILSNEKNRSVRFRVTQGSIRLLANNPEREEAEEEVPADYYGAELEMGFNVGYLMDAVGAVTSEQVRITLSDPGSCGLIENVGREDSQYVVMPLRI